MNIGFGKKKMASSTSRGQQETTTSCSNTSPKFASDDYKQVTSEELVDSTDTGVLPGEMSELKRVQLAHEGMKLLLCSDIKAAEELFRTSRYLGPELNAGYSFVQLLRAIMTFDEESIDFAYKCLESTEKFCDSHNRKFSFLSSSSSSNNLEKLSSHERLYRRIIIADCLLFEAVLVFLKQGLTSYIKGGYLLRKAWKMYEKINQEVELVCTLPSPITKAGVSSPTDKHVGSSIYDKGDEVIGEEDQEEVIGAENGEEIKEVTENLSSLHIGFGLLGGGDEECPIGGEEENKCEDTLSSLRSNDMSLSGGPPSSVVVSNGGTSGGGGGAMKERSASEMQIASHRVGVASGSDGRSYSADNLLSLDETDGASHSRKRGKGSKKHRPQSGYFAPDIPTTDIHSLDHEDARLRGALYFGYGLMNIIMSLIPPKLMKLANLFGFHGDRRVGLQALEFASNSQDMKAPLARIALLWYHTTIRPFFALDGEDEDAGAVEATRLLDEAQSKFSSSALFLYFRGKVLYLQCRLPEALQLYSEAAILAREQREIEHIALYEKGWIHFLQLEYDQALPCYVRLKNETRWSACYYAYLAAILSGIQGDLKQSRELFLQAAKLVKRKNNNLEKFCARRGSHYKRSDTDLLPLEARLFAIEVIYLWRALPFCSEDTKKELLETLNMALPPGVKPVHQAMRAWLRGGVLNSLGQVIEAEKSLHEALQYEQQIKNDKHILSFSLYELAMIHIDRGEYARARTMLNLAKEGYTGYEFEARLNFKVHSAMSLVK